MDRPLRELDPSSDRAKFRQIADVLRDEIRTGRLAPGERLPSERELIEAYGAARGTVRQALAILGEEGLTDTQHGRGVFVRQAPPLHREGSVRFAKDLRRTGGGAFQAEVEAQGRVSRQEVLERATLRAPAFVAERLGLDDSEEVFVRRRRMSADGVPMQLADSYWPVDLVRDTPITHADTGLGGSYARLEELGHRPARFREELSARMPTDDERRALRLGPGTPVVRLIRTAFDDDGTPVEVFDSVLAADRHVFTYDFNAD